MSPGSNIWRGAAQVVKIGCSILPLPLHANDWDLAMAPKPTLRAAEEPREPYLTAARTLPISGRTSRAFWG
jgi:hypothetical protein